MAQKAGVSAISLARGPAPRNRSGAISVYLTVCSMSFTGPAAQPYSVTEVAGLATKAQPVSQNRAAYKLLEASVRTGKEPPWHVCT
jgi:hypothetical protein